MYLQCTLKLEDVPPANAYFMDDRNSRVVDTCRCVATSGEVMERHVCFHLPLSCFLLFVCHSTTFSRMFTTSFDFRYRRVGSAAFLIHRTELLFQFRDAREFFQLCAVGHIQTFKYETLYVCWLCVRSLVSMFCLNGINISLRHLVFRFNALLPQF